MLDVIGSWSGLVLLVFVALLLWWMSLPDDPDDDTPGDA